MLPLLLRKGKANMVEAAVNLQQAIHFLSYCKHERFAGLGAQRRGEILDYLGRLRTCLNKIILAPKDGAADACAELPSFRPEFKTLAGDLLDDANRRSADRAFRDGSEPEVLARQLSLAELRDYEDARNSLARAIGELDSVVNLVKGPW